MTLEDRRNRISRCRNGITRSPGDGGDGRASELRPVCPALSRWDCVYQVPRRQVDLFKGQTFNVCRATSPGNCDEQRDTGPLPLPPNTCLFRRERPGDTPVLPLLPADPGPEEITRSRLQRSHDTLTVRLRRARESLKARCPVRRGPFPGEREGENGVKSPPPAKERASRAEPPPVPGPLRSPGPPTAPAVRESRPGVARVRRDRARLAAGGDRRSSTFAPWHLVAVESMPSTVAFAAEAWRVRPAPGPCRSRGPSMAWMVPGKRPRTAGGGPT